MNVNLAHPPDGHRTALARPAAVALLLLTTTFAALAAPAQPGGRIAGRVTSPGGEGLAGVTVRLEPDGGTTETREDGSYSLEEVAPGRYRISFQWQDTTTRPREIAVGAGATVRVDDTLAAGFHFAENLTVEAASRRPERLVDAPAAVTLITAPQIELEGSAGQVPRLLASTPGGEAVQNGLYDYNFNTRGFNSFLNRRIQTIIDGRDPSITDTSGQEWFTMVLLADDLQSMELVRGPSSALYGPNAVNGVLSLTTKAPRDSQGGRVRLTTGELETFKLDLRWAGGLGAGWYLKALGNHTESKSFSRSRDQGVEYPGLPGELVPLPSDRIVLDSLSLRADKYLADDRLLSVEGATAYTDGGIFMTPAQRAYIFDSPPRYWGRANLSSPHWNLLASFTSRDAEALALAADFKVYTRSWQYETELQGHRDLAGGRLRLVGGLAFGDEEVDSRDPGGNLTLYSEVVRAQHQAAFGQLDWAIADHWKLVFALRWDGSDLHPAQVTPKGSLVFAPTPRHTLRLGYNEAFQVANYSELFLRVPAGPPLDLSFLDPLLPPLPPGFDLGLGAVPIFDLGNPALNVEKIRSVELGYNAILGDHLLLTVDYYRNNLRDFIGSLPFGFPTYLPPYVAPAGLPPELAAALEAALRAALPGLTNAPDGSPFVALSRSNTGEIDSQGVELALSYALGQRWLLDLNGSWFDHRVQRATLGADVTPNRPRLQGGLGATYRHDRLDAAARLRWVEGFDWASGFWIGPVPAYQVLDLSAAWHFADAWTVHADIANALDDTHYEAFGADLIGRRALLGISRSW